MNNLVITKEHIRYIKRCIRCFGERDSDKVDDLTSDVLEYITRYPIPDNGSGSFGLVRFMSRQVFCHRIKAVSGTREYLLTDIQWSKKGTNCFTDIIDDKIDREKIYVNMKQLDIDVYELRRQGMSNISIAELYGVTRQSVEQRLRKCESFGLPHIRNYGKTKMFKNKDYRYLEIHKLKSEGKTVKEIASMLDISIRHVWDSMHLARKRGLFVEQGA